MLLAIFFGATAILIFYLFYRTEVLKRELKVAKARLTNSQNSGKHQCEMIVLLAQNQANLLKQKLSQVREISPADTEAMQLLSAILSQYSNIVGDIALKNDSVSKSVERYIQRSSQLSLQEVNKIISKQSNEVKHSWQQNNLAGFVRFCELLLEPVSFA